MGFYSQIIENEQIANARNISVLGDPFDLARNSYVKILPLVNTSVLPYNVAVNVIDFNASNYPHPKLKKWSIRGYECNKYQLDANAISQFMREFVALITAEYNYISSSFLHGSTPAKMTEICFKILLGPDIVINPATAEKIMVFKSLYVVKDQYGSYY